MVAKVAVVTGSNKGIGFAIVRTLLQRGVETVYLTARDPKRGKEAVAKLKEEGMNPEFHQLEVTKKVSVKTFAYFLKQKHGGIDILINNAAVINAVWQETTLEDSERVIETNYQSILTIQEHLFPILKDNARVIHISSDVGHISVLENPYWINRLSNKDIKFVDVNDFVNWFLESVRKGSLDVKDFQSHELLAYKVSKLAVNALTRVQQKQIGRNISINAIHPGLVQTDMTLNNGMMTPEQSSDAVVYLALDVDQSVKGRYFWYDKTEKDWTDHSQKIHNNREEIKNFFESIGFDIKAM